MNPDIYAVVLTTVGSETDAGRLARLLVEEGLAACITIMPEVRSFYKWKNQLCEDVEWVLLIKTRKECKASIEIFFQKNHPYQLPELIMLPIIEGKEEYFQWMDISMGRIQDR
jgi:periplasmic divalent cation tolerance protein